MGNVQMTCCSGAGKDQESEGSIPAHVNAYETGSLRRQESFGGSESSIKTICPDIKAPMAPRPYPVHRDVGETTGHGSDAMKIRSAFVVRTDSKM